MTISSKYLFCGNDDTKDSYVFNVISLSFVTVERFFHIR